MLKHIALGALLVINNQHAMDRSDHLNSKTQTKKFNRAMNLADKMADLMKRHTDLRAHELSLLEQQTCDDCLVHTSRCACSGYLLFKTQVIMQARQAHQPIFALVETALPWADCLTGITCFLSSWCSRRKHERLNEIEDAHEAMRSVEADLVFLRTNSHFKPR